MLCQPIADRSTEGGTSKGEREERTSQGKRKRARDENEREAREGDGAPEIPHRRAWEARSARVFFSFISIAEIFCLLHYCRNVRICGHGRGWHPVIFSVCNPVRPFFSALTHHSPSPLGSARVLVPFGLLRAKAAEGCWAEALQLVLTPSAAATATKGQETGGRAEGGDLVGPNGGGAESVLTLPGGLWDAVRFLFRGVWRTDICTLWCVNCGRETVEWAAFVGVCVCGWVGSVCPIKICVCSPPNVGALVSSPPECLSLFAKEEDGGDPESDDNRALIGTAIRACKSTEG